MPTFLAVTCLVVLPHQPLEEGVQQYQRQSTLHFLSAQRTSLHHISSCQACTILTSKKGKSDLHDVISI
jgi:hypothetical protein